MKKLFALFALFACFVSAGALPPPIQPQQLTTNSSAALPNALAVLTGTSNSAGFLTISNGVAAGNPAVYANWNTGTNSFYFNVGADLGAGSFGSLLINPLHDGPANNPANVEWQWITPGSWAITPGQNNGNAGHLQFGSGFTDVAHQFGGNWMYFQNMGPSTFTNGHSAALTFRANTGNGSGGSIWGFHPGIVSQVTRTNGSDGSGSDYELDIFPNLDPTDSTLGADNWDVRNQKTNGLRFMWGTSQRNVANFGLPIDALGTDSLGTGLNVTNKARIQGGLYVGSVPNFEPTRFFSSGSDGVVQFGQGGGDTDFYGDDGTADNTVAHRYFRLGGGGNWFGKLGLAVGKASAAANGVFSVGTAGQFAVDAAGNMTAPTNVAPMFVITNSVTLGTRYTNNSQRAFIAASFTLTAAVAGTAKVTLYVENNVTNKLSISSGPLAGLTIIDVLALPVNPNAVYYYADESSGTGASVAFVANTFSRTLW